MDIVFIDDVNYNSPSIWRLMEETHRWELIVVENKKSECMFPFTTVRNQPEEKFVPQFVPDYWPAPKKQPNNPVFVTNPNRRRSYRKHK